MLFYIVWQHESNDIYRTVAMQRLLWMFPSNRCYGYFLATLTVLFYIVWQHESNEEKEIGIVKRQLLVP